jgi:uncharacterized protein (TIGR03435 family)
MMTHALASALLHFIWEGVLICCVYACLKVWLGSRGAPFRYGLACAAMIALIAAPVATFIMCLPRESTAPVMSVAGRIATAAETTADLWFAPSAVDAMRTWRDVSANWIVFAWLIGVLVFSVRLAGGWMMTLRLRSRLTRAVPPAWQERFDALRVKLALSQPIRLATSPLVHTPTVIGWWRPMVLVPLSAISGLEPDLVAALLAHELTHIQRNDYLVNALQCAAEAALFYHPAVWWISRQIREERERCCDDMAVSLCGDTLTYVRALAELESRRSIFPTPALAANGGSLSARIARLLGMPGPRARMNARGSMTAGFLAAAALLIALHGSAQTTVPASKLPAFDAASIKPSAPDTPLKVDFAAGGRLTISHATLRFLIKIAYDVSDQQILDGPGWINSRRFDLQGTPLAPYGGDPTKMTPDQILVFHGPTRLRLQRLLADRFNLELKKESQPMPIFALVLGKSGSKLKPTATAGDPEMSFNHDILQAKRVDMPTLARFLSEGQTGRPVIDETGIPGKFDFRLEWTPDPSLDPLQAASQTQPSDAGISVFTALQQQLGLKLEPRTSPADALVVKRAELPTAN